MELPTKELKQLHPSVPRDVSLVALASFHAAFNKTAKLARVVGSATTKTASSIKKVGKITLSPTIGNDISFSHGADSRKIFCDTDDVVTPGEVLSAVEDVGIEDLIMRQTVTIRDVKGLPPDVSEKLEEVGTEQLITLENIRGFSRSMFGIGCVSPKNILSGALASVDPNGAYNSTLLSRRVRGIQMQDAIVLDNGGKYMDWCALRPDHLTHKMLVDALSQNFYMDIAMPRRVSVADDVVTGVLYRLNKYGGYLGTRS